MSDVKGPQKSDPQPFLMKRKRDETGNSGTGVVMEGTVYSDGWVSYQWRSGRKTRIWAESFEAFRELHIDAHPENETEIIWCNDKYVEELEELKKKLNELEDTSKKDS